MPLRRLPEALLAAALLFSSHALQADNLLDTDVAVCPNGRDGVIGGDLLAYEAQLAARAATCAHDADFLAWHGALLNRLGRFQAAADQLERALLLDPRLMGARIDYAEALAATGQAVAARQLLQEVLHQPGIPPAIAGAIARSLGHVQDASRGWQRTGGFTLRAGYDSNLNRATHVTSLALTLPGGEVALPLDKKSRAYSGASHLVEIQGQAVRRLDNGQHLHLYGELRQRISPGVNGMDTMQADFAALWRLPYGATRNERSLVLAAGNLAYGGHEVYRYLRLSLARDWGKIQACQPYVGVDAEQRGYPGNPLLDHRFLQLQSTWVCGSGYPINLQFGLGREQADGTRPGGDAWRLGTRITALRPVGAGQIEGELRYGLRHDDNAYSPLLGGGAALRVHSLSGRVEYRRNISPAWQALVSLETGAQYANLALFDLRNTAVHAGLRLRW